MNVTVKDCEINGDYYVGGVLGYARGDGTVSGSTLLDSKVTGSHTNVGGIVGHMSNDVGSIENCLVQSSTGKSVNIMATIGGVGGIVGTSYCLISGCKVINGGVLTIAGDTNAGGIVGYSHNDVIACLVSEVNVTASSGVGGIAGGLSKDCLYGNYAYNCTTGETSEAFTGVANVVGTCNEATGTASSNYYHAYNDSWEDLVTPVPNSSGELEPGTPVDWITASENMNRNLTGYIWGGTYDAPTLTAR